MFRRHRRPPHHRGPAADSAGDPAGRDSDQRARLERRGRHARGHRQRARRAAIPGWSSSSGPARFTTPRRRSSTRDRLQPLADRYADQLIVVMRSYFEKPRTSVGWKGLINDPDLDESFHINKGLRLARQLLLDVNDLGLPTGVRVPRHADPAAHRRPHLVGRDRRAHHGKPGPPRAGVRAVDAGRLQERHRRQHADRGRRRAVGAVAALVSVGHQAGRVGDLPDHRQRHLPRDPARRHAHRAELRRRARRRTCARGCARRGCARR